MTGKEKLQRLLDTKKQVEKEARWRYLNDPEVRLVIERLKKINSSKRVSNA